MASEASAAPVPMTVGKPESDEEYDDDGDQSVADTDDSSRGRDSVIASASDDDASSELDEVESERRRNECMDNMVDLESQFDQLKEQLYREKITLVTVKLDEVKNGTAKEYLVPLKNLEDMLKKRLRQAEVQLELRRKNIQNISESNILAALQDFESNKQLVRAQIEEEINEKIRKLEEDRHNTDITSDLYENQTQKRLRRSNVTVVGGHAASGPERRKKPVTVQGPYIVYRLREAQIIEDWSFIKLAIKQAEKANALRESANAVPQPCKVRVDNGLLSINSDIFGRGHSIIVKVAKEAPVQAMITNITPVEVTARREDGVTIKVHVSQLQAGKFSIRRGPIYDAASGLASL